MKDKRDIVSEITQFMYALLLMLVVCGFSRTDAEADFVGAPVTQRTLVERDTLRFECQVSDQGSDKVEWWYVTDHAQLSSNSEILNDHDKRYSIQHPDPGRWNLQINSVVLTDTGTYECRISSTSKRQVYQLTVKTVNGGSTLPTTALSYPEGNFTDCCVELEVKSSCLPVCNPSTVDQEKFDPVRDCATDLPKVLHCGSSGRNHIPCCHRRYVPDICLDFCINNVPTDLTMDYFICINISMDIIQCFEEGLYLLPSPPHAVEGEAHSGGSIAVSWYPPLENEDKVTGYKVFYQESGDSYFRHTGKLDNYDYTIKDVSPSTIYRIYVIALSHHGSSLPSYIFMVKSKSSQPVVPVTGYSLTDCCKSQHVSEECSLYFCETRSELADKPPTQCFREADKIQACLAGGMDNTPCCEERGVDPHCLSFCAGKAIEMAWNSSECLSKMSEITPCLNENAKNLPSYPEHVRLLEVTGDSVSVSWDKPAVNSDKVVRYIVHYKKTQEADYTIQSVETTILEIGDLEANTNYELFVTAESDLGSSIHSTTANFVTYDEEGSIYWDVTTLPPPETPANISECCKADGIAVECLSFCDYEREVSLADVALVQKCEHEIGRILHCAADGRDHRECCALRGVAQSCLPVCAMTRDEAEDFDTTKNLLCIASISDIMQCFTEGLVKIPTRPETFYVVSFGSHDIKLAWGQPHELAETVDHYIVQYKQEKEQTWQMTTTKEQGIILQNLRSDTIYTMRVMARSSHGQSFPSDEIMVHTLRENSQWQNATFNVSIDFTDCCRGMGVSEECMPGCSGTGTVDLHTCAHDLSHLIECAADGLNHRKCCEDHLVPDVCLSYCEGKPKADSIEELLCPTVLEDIVTCFREGNANLPSSPLSFKVTKRYNDSLTFAWEPSEKNAVGIKYNLFYKEDNKPLYYIETNWSYPLITPFGGIRLTVDIVNSIALEGLSYTLTGLKPFTAYLLYLEGYNAHGTSLPTPRIRIFTTNTVVPELDIVQVPPGFVKVGSNVSLICHAKNVQNSAISWRHNGKLSGSQNNSNLVISSVSASDIGVYLCETDNVKSDSHALKIKAYPIVIKEHVLVETDMNVANTVSLRCTFSGYPDSIHWSKHSGGDKWNLVPAPSEEIHRIIVSSETDLATGLITSTLQIAQIEPADLGQYRCQGKNGQGKATGHRHLKKSEGEPTSPPDLPERGPANLTACCIENDVHKDCLPACSFDLSLKALEDQQNTAVCIPDLPKMIRCGADGKDHTSCCKRKSVSPVCWPICSGIIDDELDTEHIPCISQINEIVECMEDGHDNIPGEPRRVQAREVNAYIMVDWNPPAHNADKVQQYIIYNQVGHNNKFVEVKREMRGETTGYIKSVFAHTTYAIYVVASNDFGNSQPSNTVEITTDELKPGPPTSVHAHLNEEGYIYISWNMPIDHAGAVQKYVIHYSAAGEFLSVTVNSTARHHLLTETLLPHVNYTIYMTSVGSHHTSDHSKSVHVLTEEIPESESQKSKSGSKAGLAIGMVLLLVFVAGVAVIVVIWFIRKRKQETRFPESVRFENPGYATAGEPQVHVDAWQKDDKADNNVGKSDGAELNDTTDTPIGSSPFPQINIDFKPEESEDNAYATIPISKDATNAGYNQ